MRQTRAAAADRTPRPRAAGTWRLVAVARLWLAGAVIVGLGQGVLLVAQADILARLLAGALYGGLPSQRRAGADGGHDPASGPGGMTTLFPADLEITNRCWCFRPQSQLARA